MENKENNSKFYKEVFTKELLAKKFNSKSLCYEYNNLKPSEKARKLEVLNMLFNSIDGNCNIEPSFYCDYGFNIDIGKSFYSGHNLVILDCDKVTIGDNVLIGPNSSIYTVGHPIEVAKRKEGYMYKKPVTIGNNVWIGGNVVILPGVTIGDNVTIGAGSVVTKDILSDTVAFGNPCKPYKNINE